MTQEAGDQSLAEHRRKEIFRAIVDAQDQKHDVPESRRLAMRRFEVTGQSHGRGDPGQPCRDGDEPRRPGSITSIAS